MSWREYAFPSLGINGSSVAKEGVVVRTPHQQHLVEDAGLRLVEENARYRATVREGVAQADRGELIDDEEVRLWLEQQERS